MVRWTFISPRNDNTKIFDKVSVKRKYFESASQYVSLLSDSGPQFHCITIREPWLWAIGWFNGLLYSSGTTWLNAALHRLQLLKITQ